MSKNFRSLLIALAVVGTASANTTQTNVTSYFGDMAVRRLVRPIHRIIDKDEDRFGFSIDVAGFASRTTNKQDLAKMFGANGTDAIAVVPGIGNTVNTNANVNSVYSEYLAHHTAGGNSPLAGRIKFGPEQTVYGVVANVRQDLSKWLDGAYINVEVPFLHVENNLGIKVEDATDIDINAEPGNVDKVRLSDIISGKCINRFDAGDQASALRHGKYCDNSKSDIGDIVATVGWTPFRGDKYSIGFNASAIFPTSGKPDPQYLWGARADAGKWGVGVGADASGILWQQDDQSLTAYGSIRYKYLFEGTERRNLGLKSHKFDNGTKVDERVNPLMSHMYLVGEIGNAGLKHLADVTCLDVKVKPGSQIDGTVMLAYGHGGFTLSAAYNVGWKEEEQVKLKNRCPFGNKQYGIANETYDAEVAFEAANTAAGTDAGIISACDLDMKRAQTHAQLAHSVKVGVDYETKTWDYPIGVGAFVGYTLPSDSKHTPEGYSFGVNARVAF